MREGDDETSAEAEWDTEIDARVKDIEEARVELVSADEVIDNYAAVDSHLAECLPHNVGMVLL